MLKLVLVALQKYKINCLKGWALKTYFRGTLMCAIYIFAVVAAVHPFDILTLQTLETFIFSIRSWSLCRIMRQDRSNWGQARAVQKNRIWWKLISLRICHRRNSIRNLQQCCAENGIKTKLLRVGLFYLWEQSWAQFESGTMRGSRCPTFHFIDSLQI